MKRSLNQSDTVNSELKRHSRRLSRFVFTLNNYDEDSEVLIKSFYKKVAPRWIIYGKEKAPTTGTPHLQGACVIGRQVAFTSILHYLPEGIHLAEMKGTPHQNFEYCSKEGDYVEYGTRPQPGKRNDLITMANLINSGHSLSEICEEDTLASVFIRYPRGCRELENIVRKPRDPDASPPTVCWLYGATGTGKTRAAVEFLHKQYGRFWMSGLNPQWFDGYEGQKGVILDDIRPETMPFVNLLKLLDRYPLRVPIKGSTVEWIPELIIVTTPDRPNIIYNQQHDDIRQLDRRITHLLCYTDTPTPLQDILYTQLSNGEEESQPIQAQSEMFEDSESESGRDRSLSQNELYQKYSNIEKNKRAALFVLDLTSDDDQ